MDGTRLGYYQLLDHVFILDIFYLTSGTARFQN